MPQQPAATARIASRAARNGNPSPALLENGQGGQLQISMNPDWLAYVYAATDRLFVTRLGPEISTAAKDYCPVFGGQNSTAKASSLAAAGDDYEPGALRDSIRFFLLVHALIVMATGSGERTYAAYVELGHRVVAWGHDMGYSKGPQPFLRPALYAVRGASL